MRSLARSRRRSSKNGPGCRYFGFRLRSPELRSLDRASALEVHRLDPDLDHALRRLALNREACHELRGDGNARSSVHAQRLAHTGNQEQQCHARIGHDVAQAVDAVVAAAFGQQQRLLVLHRHEARRVAARRCVEAARSRGGEHRKRRRGNQRLVARVQVRHFLLERSFAGLAEQGFELLDGFDGIGHGRSLFL
jgi:hypothetical protein